MRSIELFTGAGGLALATHRAGFEHVCVIERDHSACETLRMNVQQEVEGIRWPINEEDVARVDYASFSHLSIDLLAGGAPCQPFSLGGKHAGEADPRNMFPEVFRAVRALRPRAILLENVRGLTRESFRPYFDYLQNQLRFPFIVQRPHETWWQHANRLQLYVERDSGVADDESYTVGVQLYNAADFGVPQERFRVFMVAFRRDTGVQWAFPSPTHAREALLYAQFVDGSYWDAHGVKPQPIPPRFANQVTALARLGRPMSERWRTVRDALADLPEPINYDPDPPMNHHMGIPDARIYPGHTGSPIDWPAKAIKAGDHGNPGGENMLRRSDDSVRYFTVRELARLQTFPDYWHFATSWSECRRQIGNAVPIKLVEALAHEIHAKLMHAATNPVLIPHAA